jgi:NADH dehydrogenase [ubiquinone] 1 alpha subcomplex assembly factor 5
MSHNAAPPKIFNAQTRGAKRRRASAIAPIHDHFLVAMLADELADRLAFVSRQFRRVALVGPVAGQAHCFSLGDAEVDSFAFGDGEIGAFLPAEGLLESLTVDGDIGHAKGRYDLIIAAPMMDAVNDLPGVLAQYRLALQPDGLFLGAFFASGSLATLRAVMQAADDGRGVARIHPQVDLRSLGDLMQRARFALPVVDEQSLTLTYADPMKALTDLRALGQGNALATQTPMSGKGALIRALTDWAERADADGRVAEQLAIAHLSGWAPSPDQPKPARRGSATVSLADALRAKPQVE